jgi:hypothetical protein
MVLVGGITRHCAESRCLLRMPIADSHSVQALEEVSVKKLFACLEEKDHG